MNGTQIQSEFGEEFVILNGKYSNRVPYRGLNGRSIHQISRREFASLFDEIEDDFWETDHRVLYLSVRLGVARLSNESRIYLEKVIDWYLEGQ